jgi:uncharacterized membrane protein
MTMSQRTQQSQNSSGPAANWYLIVMGACLLVTAILLFGPLLKVNNAANAIITILVGVVLIVVHGSRALGWRNIFAFLIITIGLSFAAEAIGVATGLVFGPYYYTDLLGPKILGVPPLIQGGYVAMGYASFMAARVILGLTGSVQRWSILAVALLGAFIMVSWDVAMDPYQSTVYGDWIWTTGGPYFGVGIHNFVGWFATVFVFMLVYLLYASRYPERPDMGMAKRRIFWSAPIIYYALNAFGVILVPFIGGVTDRYASPDNYKGTLAVLENSLALVATFVMGTPVVAAICRLLGDQPAQALSDSRT